MVATSTYGKGFVMPTKSPLEVLGIVLSLVLAAIAVFSHIIRPFTKWTQNEAEMKELQTRVGHLEGKAEATEKSVGEINLTLVQFKADVLAKLEFLIKQRGKE